MTILWEEIQPAGDSNQNWTGVAISADGTKQLACVYGGRTWFYDGAAWVDLQPTGDEDRNWNTCAMNADGTRFLVAEYAGRAFYYDGESWEQVQPKGDVNGNWQTCKMNANGDKMLLAEYSGRVFYYDGASWDEEEFDEYPGDYEWTGVALSDDGSKRVACLYQWAVYTLDSGVWSEEFPSGAGVYDTWSECDNSADGSVIACCTLAGNVWVKNGSWAENSPPSLTGSRRCVRLNADGSQMLTVSEPGRIWFYDGEDWTEERPLGDTDANWSQCDINDDGSALIASITNGRLYLGKMLEPTLFSVTTGGSLNLAGIYDEDIEEELDPFSVNTTGQIQYEIELILPGAFTVETTGELLHGEIDVTGAARQYEFRLTGKADGLADVTIPIKSFQSRLKSGDPSYLSVVIPTYDYADDVTDRSSGEMVLRMRYVQDGETLDYTEIARVSLDDIQIDRGAKSKSITLVGYGTETYFAKSITLENATYHNLSDGKLRYRCKPNLYVRPGDTVTIDGNTFTANTISWSVSEQNETFEVTEAD